MADRFDMTAFFSALNAVRAERDLSWKEVATQARVNQSTLTRIGQGRKPDVNGLAALLSWSGLKAESFIAGANSSKVEPIAAISTILRTDKSLSSNSARIIEELVASSYRALRKRKGDV